MNCYENCGYASRHLVRDASDRRKNFLHLLYKMLLYLVFSPSDEQHGVVYDDVVHHYYISGEHSGAPDGGIEKSYLVVKEYGANGAHPHYNVVIDVKVSRANIYGDRVRRRLKKALKESYAKPVFCCKTITNVKSLIAKYLMKETNKEILWDSGKYPVKDWEEQEQNKLKYRTNHRWKYVPKYLEFPIFFFEYQKGSKLVLSVDEIMKRMTSEGICCVHLYNKKETLQSVIYDIYDGGKGEFYKNIFLE